MLPHIPDVPSSSQVSSGEADCQEPGQSNFPSAIRIALHCSVVPTAIAVLLIIIGAASNTLPCVQAGFVMYVVPVLYLFTLSVWILYHLQHSLSPRGRLATKITIAAFPFLVVRVVYLILEIFEGLRFSPLFGDWRIFVGMGLSMEVAVVAILLTARISAEPISRRKSSQ